jgi:ribosome recycling factor
MDDIEAILEDAEHRMELSLTALQRELGHLRAGRATPALVDHIKVEAYGAEMPLNQLATITTPDATTILISPYDKSITGAIEKAINLSDLGLMPQSDGSLIRLNVPPLTEERRGELLRLVKKHGEEGRVALRNVRRDANEQIKRLQKG